MQGSAGYQVDEEQMRASLFEDNVELVSRIARHLLMRLPAGQQMDDFMQVGLMGLWEASKRYQASEGASFKTFASIYIRGAILDELRRLSWTPRTTQQKAKRIGAAIREVEAREGRPATAAEIATELGESLESYNEMLVETAAAWLVPLDNVDQDEGSMVDDGSPAASLEDDAFRAHLVQVIEELPEREKLVISLYYQDELNLREIGEVLGVGESRVCQIHSQAVSRIRSRVHESWLADGP